jgi:hypothetical protein
VARVALRDQAATTVPLADLHVQLNQARMSAVCEFLVQPAETREVLLELPPGCRLVQVLADQAAAQCVSAGFRTWRIAAPSDRLPYVLTVVYDGAVTEEDGTNLVHLAAPQLLGTKVDRWIWSVSHGGGMTSRVSPPVNLAGAYEAELIRLDVINAALADVASLRDSELPRFIVSEGLERWRRAFRRSQRMLADLPAPPDKSEGLALRLAAAEETAAKIFAGMPTEQAGDDLYTDSSAAVVISNQYRGEPPFIAITDSAAVSLEILRTRTDLAETPAFWAALFAIGSLALWSLSRWRVGQEWIAEHAHLVLAIIGFLWWLLAPAGWLGWVLVVMAIWLAARSPWRRQTFESGSTIQRMQVASRSQ